MKSGILRAGDTVNWRGVWGSGSEKDAVIKAIEIGCSGREGQVVNAVPWSAVNDRSVIVSLTNGRWAYGNQITPKNEVTA